MAAVVAQQHAAGLWHRRPEHSFHVPDLHYTGMMTSYNDQRTAMDAPSLRSYQPPTSQMDLSLPLFSANALATSVPYQSSGTFAYDSSVNPYNIQQNGLPQVYGLNYSSSMPSTVSYAGRSEPQSLPTVHDTRHAFSLNGNHMVKSESASPVQSNPVFNDGAYMTSCKRSSSEPAESSNINFATDVDTLMKAIQAKQTTSPSKKDAAKVSTLPMQYDHTLTISSWRSQRHHRNLGSGISAICLIAIRASIKRHISRSTSEHILVQSHS
jgi:hypothetical protein